MYVYLGSIMNFGVISLLFLNIDGSEEWHNTSRKFDPGGHSSLEKINMLTAGRIYL